MLTRKKAMEKGKLIVEIDINTVCNLSCNNCNRFSQFKSTFKTLDKYYIDEFIVANKHYGKDLVVAILGGEPTLHPDIDYIIINLAQHFNVILTTNGLVHYTPPVDIVIEDSSKTKDTEPVFALTMNAPIDDPVYTDMDFSMGCRQSGICGNGFNERGYYPCSVAMNIDRMMHLPGGDLYGMSYLASDTLSNSYAYRSATLNKLCRYCGTFQNRHYGVLKATNLGTEQVFSRSWKFMEKTK
jgi:hypothetical protein